MSTASAAFKTISRSTTGLPPFIIATGGTEYLSGGYKYHEFNSSGTWTVKSIPPFTSTTATGGLTANSCIDVMVVGGGGGGGQQTTVYGGGGGAGGYVFVRGIRVVPGNYEVVVGAGGTGDPSNPSPGGSSAFGRGVMSTPLTALGGGGGYPASTLGARNGGSGGGGGWPFGNTGGTGQQPTSTTGGKGNNGGTGNSSGFSRPGGGSEDSGDSTAHYRPFGTISPLFDSKGFTGKLNVFDQNLNPTNDVWVYACGGEIINSSNGQNANSGNGGNGTSTVTAGNGGSGNVIIRYPCAYIYNQK
jgi:hypothetical protein